MTEFQPLTGQIHQLIPAGRILLWQAPSAFRSDDSICHVSEGAKLRPSASDSPNMHISVRQQTYLALIVAAFILCYARASSALVEVWSTNYFYSYGFAVPLISGYIVWTRWARIQALSRTPDFGWGVATMVVGASLLVIGRLGAFLSLEQISILVTLTGLVLLLLGRAAARLLAFPILYLFLALPLLDYPISKFQEPSQTISARIALGILHPVGIPALREGTRLVLPSVTLDVLRECSGVNQLVAIVAMTLPAGVLWLNTLSRRFALVVIAIFTAYVSNGLRIAIIGVLAYNHVNGVTARGPLHLLQGLVVSALGYAFIAGCLSLLARSERNKVVARPESSGDPVSWRAQRFGLVHAFALFCLLIAGGYATLFRPIDLPLPQQLGGIPTVIGDWSAEPATLPILTSGFGGVDDELSRVYRNTRGDRVRLYIGYHNYQREGKEFTAAAEQALKAGAPLLEVRIHGGKSDGTQPEAPAQDPRRRILWYDVNGRMLSTLYGAKAYNIWDAVTARHTNAALVIIDWNGDQVGVPTADDAAAATFVEQLLPILRRYLPSKNRMPTSSPRVAAGLLR
jgi:EpsI family protein